MNDDDYEFTPGEKDPVEEMCYWMAEPCFPVLRASKPDPTSSPITTMTTLEEYYNTPTMHLVIRVVDGEWTATQAMDEKEIEIDDLAPRSRLSNVPMSYGVPVYHPSNVKTPWDAKDQQPARPQRVFLFLDDYDKNKEEVFFKPSYHGSDKELNEIDALLRLQRCGLADKFRVLKLRGLVSSAGEDGTEISGFLLTHIEVFYSLSSARSLSSVSRSIREQWIGELKLAIDEFHKAGIVWGDVKPDNILVDVKNDLWIVDFGGSYTPVWVDESLKVTEQGDLQGLSKIVRYLRDEK